MSRTRPLLAVVLLAAFAFVLAGCDDDPGTGESSADEPTSTTQGASSDDERTEGTDSFDGIEPEPRPAVSDDEFAAALDGLDAQVEAARGDICALLAVFVDQSQLPDPANQTQTQRAVGSLAPFIRAIADAAGSEFAAEGAAFAAAADRLEADAAAAGYDPSYLAPGGPPPPALSTEEFSAAANSFFQVATDRCNAEAAEPAP